MASALKGRELYDWEDVLEWLRRFDNDKIDKQVSSALELRYNFLRGEEIKSLFLLCAAFGDPEFIDIQDLLKLAFGLGMFRRSNTLEKVRHRLMALLDDLKASCLLLECKDNSSVRVHDVVHKFAVAVASWDHHVVTVASDTVLMERPTQDVFERCTAISVSYCKIPKLLEELECPNLESFTLENNNPTLEIPDGFFARTKDLKASDFMETHFYLLPLSLKYLENLRTLCFYYCQFKDIATIGELKKLPTEIGKLIGLQLMYWKDCPGLEVIPPNILSQLTQLEELCMENSFVKWDCAESDKQWPKENFGELKLLSKISTLDIHITDANMLSVVASISMY